MAEVTDAFAAYVAKAQESGVDVAGYLADGLPAATVAARLTEVGLTPHESLIEWFGQANGVEPDASGPGVFGGRDLLSLDDAIADRRETLVADEDEDAIYEPSWFPIIGDHPIVVVDTENGNVLTVDLEAATETSADSLDAWIMAQQELIPSPGTLHKFRHTFFEPGLREVHLSDKSGLSWFASTVVEEPLERLVITYAEPGSIDGNEGLERMQAELVVEYLISEGAPIDGIVEYRIGPGGTKGHSVRMSGI